jgi:sortase A
VWVIDPVPGRPNATPTKALLTLTTCNPRWASTERLIVFSHLEETTPKSAGRPAALAGGR